MVKFVMTAFLVAAMASAPKPTEILEKVDTAAPTSSSSTAAPGDLSPPASFESPTPGAPNQLDGPTPSPEFVPGPIIPGQTWHHGHGADSSDTAAPTPLPTLPSQNEGLTEEQPDFENFEDFEATAEGGNDYDEDNHESYPNFEEDGEIVADNLNEPREPVVEPEEQDLASLKPADAPAVAPRRLEKEEEDDEEDKEEEEGSDDKEDKEEKEDSDSEEEDDEEKEGGQDEENSESTKPSHDEIFEGDVVEPKDDAELADAKALPTENNGTELPEENAESLEPTEGKDDAESPETVQL